MLACCFGTQASTLLQPAALLNIGWRHGKFRPEKLIEVIAIHVDHMLSDMIPTHRFLAEQEKLTEQRLQELNMILEGDIQCPDHILDTLHHLR